MCGVFFIYNYLARNPALAWQTSTSCRLPHTFHPGKANSPYCRRSLGRPGAAAPAVTVHTHTISALSRMNVCVCLKQIVIIQTDTILNRNGLICD